ncbi:MAG: hypothetical protein HPY51_19805 [Candidatus Omnitrophica bacterium]|nr:hypothetical protein [Candidatus Omnitrophota bacterium]
MVLADFWTLFQDTHTGRILLEMKTLFVSLLPGLVSGLLASSFLAARWPLSTLKQGAFFQGPWGILFMSLAGIVSPFCSYLAIPIAAALIQGGVPPVPVFAFLFASPLMNPTLFGMTLSVFGWPMALARTVAAVGFGMLGGGVAAWYQRNNPAVFDFSGIAVIPDHPDEDVPFIHRWRRSFFHMGGFVLKFVLLGIGIAAVIKELLPMEWVERVVGRQYGYGILAGSLLGIPLYACGGGTIPFIQVMMNLGMSPGAALAFFLSGPATKVQTLAAMQLAMGTRITVVYFLLSIAWSLLAGWIYQWWA